MLIALNPETRPVCSLADTHFLTRAPITEQGLVFHPDSTSHALIEAIMTCASITQLFLEPFLLSRLYCSRSPASSGYLVPISTLCDACFMAHVFIGPLQGYRYFLPGHGYPPCHAHSRHSSPDSCSDAPAGQGQGNQPFATQPSLP